MRKAGILIAIAAVVAVCMVGVWVQAKGKPPKPPPQADPQIAFVRVEYDSSGAQVARVLCVMDADGSNETEVCRFQGGHMWSLTWAPDGSRLAFAGSENFDWHGDIYQPTSIYVVNVDGSGLQVIHTSDTYVGSVGWSPVPAPDGKHKITFIRRIEVHPYSHIYIINTDGTGLTQLTDSYFPGWPSWSPDATRLAYRGYNDPDSEVRNPVIVADLGLSSGQIVITGETSLVTPDSPLAQSQVGQVVWAKTDPNRIALTVSASSIVSVWILDVRNPDAPVRITDESRHCSGPCWSPDDSQILVRAQGNPGNASTRKKDIRQGFWVGASDGSQWELVLEGGVVYPASELGRPAWRRSP